MFGNYFTSNSSNNPFKSTLTTSTLNVPQTNLIGQNGSSSLFASRRQSNGHKVAESLSRDESSKLFTDAPQRNTSRKNSQEMRSGYSSSSYQQPYVLSEDKQETLRASFMNQKHSRSQKQLSDLAHLTQGQQQQTTNSNIFFSKSISSGAEPNIYNKKINEGQLLSQQSQKNYSVGNYTAGKTLFESGITFKNGSTQNTHHTQNSQTQPSFPSNEFDHQERFSVGEIQQQQYINSSSSGSSNGNTNQKGAQQQQQLQQQSQEKENDKYFFSNLQKKSTRLHSQEDSESVLQTKIKSPAKSMHHKATTSTPFSMIDSMHQADIPSTSSQILASAQKSRYIRDQMKTEQGNIIQLIFTHSQLFNSQKDTMTESNGFTYKSPSQQKLNDFFKPKKQMHSVSPPKRVSQHEDSKAKHICFITPIPKPPQTIQIQPRHDSTHAVQNGSYLQHQINNQPQPQSKFIANGHPPFVSNSNLVRAKAISQQQTNSHTNCSLQSSFQGGQLDKLYQEEDKMSHYYVREDCNQQINKNSSKKSFQSPHSNNNNSNLAGSIINLKKKKKNLDTQQIQQSSQLHSQVNPSLLQFQQSQGIETEPSIQIIPSGSGFIQQEVAILRMEVFKLKNQNQVLVMKTETLEKEKLHYKNLSIKKQQECDSLAEQVIHLNLQLDSLKSQQFKPQNSLHHSQQQQLQLHLHQATQKGLQETPRQFIESSPHKQNSPPHMVSNLTRASMNSASSSINNLQSIVSQYHQGNNQINILNTNNSSNQNTNPSSLSQSNGVNHSHQAQNINLKNSQNIKNNQNYNQNCVFNRNSGFNSSSHIPQARQVNTQYQMQVNQNELIQGISQSYNNQQQLFYANDAIISNESLVTLSPSRKNASQVLESKSQHNLSPIVNSEERSEFITNSILEEIPTSAHLEQPIVNKGECIKLFVPNFNNKNKNGIINSNHFNAKQERRSSIEQIPNQKLLQQQLSAEDFEAVESEYASPSSLQKIEQMQVAKVAKQQCFAHQSHLKF